MLQVCRVLASSPAIAACRAAAPAVLALVPPLGTLCNASAAAWQQQQYNLGKQHESKSIKFSRAYGAAATAPHAQPPEADANPHPFPDAFAATSSTTTANKDDPAAPAAAAAGSPHASAAGMNPLVPHPGMQKHGVPWGGGSAGVPVDVAAVMRQPVYTREYMEAIKPYHVPPKELHQRLAFRTISAVRKTFDLATGYNPETMNEAKWLRRIIFLETVAGVPGMVGGMLRHLRSLRMMQKDNGWINTLLEEAENERMHLLTFMEMRQPGRLFRGWVLLAQGVMFNMLFVAYLASPKFVHSLVGYLEEEAVKTYTHALKDIDAGRIWHDRPAPPIAQAYWRLPADATMRDLILAVRADEACHSHVNHTFAALPQDEVNPFTGKGGEVLP